MKLHRSIALAVFLSLSGAGISHAAEAVPSRAALKKLCTDCAIVRSVQTETRKGKGSGLGIVGGAVAGGALGHQIGGGSGRTIATFGGAVGGGVLGNEVEKHLKRTTVWITTVTMKDGSMRRFEAAADPRLRPGDVVSTSQGRLHRS
ncbi:MAG: glycine zipper 2TM domain-containing protein [Burkholderiaceae bacterium]